MIPIVDHDVPDAAAGYFNVDGLFLFRRNDNRLVAYGYGAISSSMGGRVSAGFWPMTKGDAPYDYRENVHFSNLDLAVNLFDEKDSSLFINMSDWKCHVSAYGNSGDWDGTIAVD